MADSSDRAGKAHLNSLRIIAEKGGTDPTYLSVKEVRQICEALLRAFENADDVIIQGRLPASKPSFSQRDIFATV